MIYQFTSEQLTKLLQNTCLAYEEYRRWPNSYVSADSQACAIREIFDGMMTERELISDGVDLEPSFTPVDEAIP